MPMLSACITSLAYAQLMLQFLMPMPQHNKLHSILSKVLVRHFFIIYAQTSWCVCWVHAWVPYTDAQCTHKFICKRGYTKVTLENGKTYAYAQCMHELLMCMLSACISYWYVHWEYTYKFLMCMLSINVKDKSFT